MDKELSRTQEIAPEPPQEAMRTAQEIVSGVLGQAEHFVIGLFRTWNAYQVAIAAALFILAVILARLIGPHLHEWMRTRQGWPRWRMRFLVLAHRRLRLILFVALIWPTVWVMRAATWPSRSYLLALAAQLALAWLVIAIATRLITNGFVRSLVRYVGWTWVTLDILGLTDDAQLLLDSMAIHLGELRLSLWLIVQAVAVIVVLSVAARFLSATASARIRANQEISPSMQVLAVKILQILLYGAAFFIGLKAVGVDLTGLAVLSGAIGVGLGFGLQKVVSNLVSGVIILLDKSIKPGDVISLGETFGWINALGARYVSITTRDGREYLIPNEDLITGQVVNWTHSDEFVRLDIFFGTSYGDDPHKVRKIAIEAAGQVDRVLRLKPPVCHIVGFGDSSVDYVLRFWIRDPTAGLTNIRGKVYLALWDAFRDHGISIPFPQRELRILGDSAGGGAGGGRSGGANAPRMEV